MNHLSLDVLRMARADKVLGYSAGTTGATVTPPAGARIVEIAGYANGADGTITIFGGDAIAVRAGTSFTLRVDGALLADGTKTIVFSGSMDYFVAWVS